MFSGRVFKDLVSTPVMESVRILFVTAIGA